MIKKLLLATIIVVSLLFFLIIAYSMFSSGGGLKYHAGPLPDASQYRLLCTKNQKAVPTDGTYTTSSDNKAHNVKANLQAALSLLDGNGLYTVDSSELLGIPSATPGDLVFDYNC